MHKKSIKRAIVVFSGYNQRAVVAFLRVVKRYEVPFGIIAKSKYDTIFLTDYKQQVLQTRESTTISFDNIKYCLLKTKDILDADELVIAPTTEALNRFFLKNQSIFIKYGCIIPLVKESLYKLISDKLSFSRLCKDEGIKIPIEYETLQGVDLPFVAKPKYYYSRNSPNTLIPVILKSEKDKSLFSYDCITDEYYFQEYIKGESKYLLYYFHSNGSVYKYSQQNLVQQPGGKSIVAAVSSDFHFSEESIKYEKLFKKINFSGFVMVEVKGDNFMIEANPRFWGPSQLFVDAKVNLFEAFLNDNRLIQVQPAIKENSHKKILYFWHGGIVTTVRNGQKLDFHEYDNDQLENNYQEFLSYDVYNRNDTYNLYNKEMD